MDMYPMVLTQKVKGYLEGLRVICLRYWKRKAVHGVFKWLGDKYGGFYRKREGENLVGVCNTVRRR